MFQYIRRAILGTQTTSQIKQFLIGQVQYVENVHRGSMIPTPNTPKDN